MKTLKKFWLLLAMLALLVMAVVGAVGTQAWFSDTETSSDNTFTAGTLNLELSNGSGWGDGVAATWVSPSNWAPGEAVTATIYLHNVGTVDAQVVYGDWTNPSYGSPNLLAVIEVTEMSDSLDGYSSNFVPAFVGVYDQNADGKLSLWELINGDAYWPGSSSPWEAVFYDTDPVTGPSLLPAGGSTYGLKMAFKFMETAGDPYQGASAGFDLVLKATQESQPPQVP